MKRAKKDTGGGSNWMDTYGDLVTLLMCFFVLLYAFSSVDQAKWNALVETFTGSPPSTVISPIDPSDNVEGLEADEIIEPIREDEEIEEMQEEQSDKPNHPTLSEEEQEAIEEEFTDLYEQLQAYIEREELTGGIQVARDENFIYLTLLDGALFDSGRANITEEGRSRLDNMGTVIFEHESSIQQIWIVGHTDSNPISTSQFPDNKHLSSARALAVADYMVYETGVDYNLVYLMGSGELDPIATNETEEGRQQNRRVEFTLSSKNNTDPVLPGVPGGGIF